MGLLKKCAAFCLAALIIALAGCGGDTSWVFKSGDDTVPAGLYILAQANATMEATQAMLDENADNPDFVPPAYKDLFNTQIDGVTGSQWINDSAKKFVSQYVAVNRKFAALGLEHTEGENAQVENTVSSMKAQRGDFYEKNGISDDSLRAYMLTEIKMGRIFMALYGEGGEFAVPDSEIRDYFKANYTKAEVLSVAIPAEVPEGETKTLDELKADAKAEADDYLKRAEAGEAMEKLVYEVATKMYPDETVEETTKEEITILVSQETAATYGKEFSDPLLNAEPGEFGQFEAIGYYFVYKCLDLFENDDLYENQKQTLLTQIRADDYTAKVDEWRGEVVLEENTAALQRYKPENIEMTQSQV